MPDGPVETPITKNQVKEIEDLVHQIIKTVADTLVRARTIDEFFFEVKEGTGKVASEKPAVMGWFDAHISTLMDIRDAIQQTKNTLSALLAVTKK